MFHRFAYEAEHYPELSRLPLHVRMKLDLTGLRISLDDWLAFSIEERTALCHLPIEAADESSAFIAYVDFLSRKYRSKPATVIEAADPSLWKKTAIPEPVAQKAARNPQPLTPAEWNRWPEHQRYALYKTAISRSQPEAFDKLLNEFRGFVQDRR